MIKKATAKKTTKKSLHHENRISKPLKISQRMTSEKAADTDALDRDTPQEDRDIVPNEMEAEGPNLSNWSEAQDRGEDLVNNRDPFVQEPELDTDVPAELTQKRTGETPNDNENLAKRFDKERDSPPL